jgi:predicted DNA-binding protein (UPF0251 family)
LKIPKKAYYEEKRKNPKTYDRKPPRPEKVLTDEQIEELRSMMQAQCTQAECCARLGMSHETLRKELAKRGMEWDALYPEEKLIGRGRLREAMFKTATDPFHKGHVRMAEVLSQQYLDFTKKIVQEQTHTVGDGSGKALELIRQEIDRLSTESLASLHKTVQEAKRAE